MSRTIPANPPLPHHNIPTIPPVILTPPRLPRQDRVNASAWKRPGRTAGRLPSDPDIRWQTGSNPFKFGRMPLDAGSLDRPGIVLASTGSAIQTDIDRIVSPIETFASGVHPTGTRLLPARLEYGPSQTREMVTISSVEIEVGVQRAPQVAIQKGTRPRRHTYHLAAPLRCNGRSSRRLPAMFDPACIPMNDVQKQITRPPATEPRQVALSGDR